MDSSNERQNFGFYGIHQIWFPRNIYEMDDERFLQNDARSDNNPIDEHITDIDYIERTNQVRSLGDNYKVGDEIPVVQYTSPENRVWSMIYKSTRLHNQRHGCTEYKRWFGYFEKLGVYSDKKIPQLREVSAILKNQSGFQLRPVGGLVSARNFLASLAFKVFMCTQYVRHESLLEHTKEPDVCHELLGHAVMFCDAAFADFSQEIGLASLGATDEDIKRLSTLYWYTIEFGLCREGSELKTYGAGLLSSVGETKHAVSKVPRQLPLNPDYVAAQEYQDQDYQPVYFVSESFTSALNLVRNFSRTSLDRDFTAQFDEATGKIITRNIE